MLSDVAEAYIIDCVIVVAFERIVPNPMPGKTYMLLPDAVVSRTWGITGLCHTRKGRLPTLPGSLELPVVLD